jgi:hypothetical protein
MSYGNLNVDTVTTSTSGGVLGAGNASLMKNRIINGACVIDQRNAGASVTQNATGIYTLDRWNAYGVVTSKFTVQENAGSVTPPAGFKNYLGCTSLSAYSLTSTDIYIIQQNIEGYNIADLGWGTADAKTVTLSFWVRSSLTGTFGGSITGSNTRNYPFSYSIPVANTWTQITITIAGDTSGTWGSTNGTGLIVNFSLGSGSNYSNTAGSWTASASYSATGATSVVGTNGATFYVTGVQLEVGSSATGFEYVDYTTQLAMCQRYYQQLGGAVQYDIICQAYGVAANSVSLQLTYPSMRAAPTATKIGTWSTANCAQPLIVAPGINCVAINSLVTASNPMQFNTTGTSTYITLSAEL